MQQHMADATPTDTSRVCMDLQPGERVVFAGTGVEIEVVSKSGRHARLRVISPRAVRIERVLPSSRIAEAA